MERKLYKKEERGLKGGPNYQVSEMMGSVTSTGYWPDSPDRNNDFNIIPSNQITMEGMDMPLMGMDNLGNTQYMTPGNNYTFPGSYVTETPVAKQGGMFLGHYTFKDGGLVRMQPGGTSKERQEKIQKDVNNTAYQGTTADWDPQGTNGAQQEPLDYDKKTGKYYRSTYDVNTGQFGREEVKVQVKPKAYVDPKTAPKKTKAQIQAEINDKYQKKAERDPTQFLESNPAYVIIPGIGPVLREGLDPEALKKLDMEKAKEDFVKDLNADPLQQSLGTASLDNPVTSQAAENYANYTVNNEDPRWATDKMLSGNDAPSTADFYRPHDATLGFGIPAAAASAVSLAAAPWAGAGAYIGEGFGSAKNFLKPYASAFNRSLGRKLLGDPGIFATQGQQILSNLATPANLLKGWGMYDLTHKYTPRAIEDVNLYNETGDTQYLTDAAYNTGKGILEGFSHIGPVAQEVQAVKRPVSFIDDARKAINAEDNASRAAYDFKTIKNTLGLIRKDGGGIYLGAYKQVGGQLVPHDDNMASFQKGGEPIYVYSKDDPAYKKYLKQKAYYDEQKALYETRGRDLIRANAPENKTASLYSLPDDIAHDQAKREAAYNRAAGLSYDALTNELLKEYERKFKSQPWYKYVDHDDLDYLHVNEDNNAFYVVRKPTPVILEKEAKPKAIDIKPLPTPPPAAELKPVLTKLPRPQTNKQRVVVNTPQGDKIRVQDIKTKKFLGWEDDKGLPSDVENPSGTASQDFPQMRRVAPPQGGFAYGGDISLPNLSRQEGGDMPFGLPLKEQNIYTLPEYNQPRNPKTGEILPDPRRPNLGMDTGATEYKATLGYDEGDVDVPMIVSGQYIGPQGAVDRYELTGERFKTMTDPGSYSNFYDQIGRLGLMQEKHGGSVKRVKIKSIPKNWKSQ